MKSSLSLFVLLALFINSSAISTKPEPEWFKTFVKSVADINRTYQQQTRGNVELQEKYNFEPKIIDWTTNKEVNVDVAGLDSFYISIEKYNGELARCEFFNAYLVDTDGEKHPFVYDKDNLLCGKMRQYLQNGEEWFQMTASIYKIISNKKYNSFEYSNKGWPDRQMRVTLSPTQLPQQNATKALKKLVTQISQEYPQAGGVDGITYEIRNNIDGIRLGDNGLQGLVDFYVENSHKSVAQDLEANKKVKLSVAEIYELRKSFVWNQKKNEAVARLKSQKIEPLIMAINDCKEEFPEKYTKADDYLQIAKSYAAEKDALLAKLEAGETDALNTVNRYFQQIDDALLANPHLDFDEIMLIKRDVNGSREKMPKEFGFPSLNSHVNTKITPIKGAWHNTVSKLSDIRGSKNLETIIDADEERLITDLEMDFNREHIMFSMENENKVWHVYEAKKGGQNLLCVTPDSLPDVNHFDACYLPDGKVIFTSDASYQGLPCEGGSRPMALLYVIDREKGKIRQLTYEQDSDFSPVVLNNGRLMYLRWEYSDLPHYFSRILMSCNPDGTAQMEYYGSNSYWPNTYIFARPIPNHPTQTVGIVGGHHGITRSGRLMIIDPAKGRSEADGVVQEIPYRGKVVEPEIKDALVNGVWPQFMHPYPLNDKYFLVSAKMNEKALWGIYLVDVFDNMTLIKEVEGSGLFDPIPVRKEPTPPVIPSRVIEGEKEANVFITDIYVGDGLKNIPRGAVKSLRLFAYHYGHIQTGGHASVGVESSWDIKRVLGTVPVEEDGSAMFKVPANTPISIQPLDSAGRALQIMRSWFVGMPGENVSCIGCHERTNQVPPNMFRMAARRGASEIEPWQGEARPFSFRYEVQPVLDKYCVSCHNGNRKSIPNFTRAPYVDMEGQQKAEYFLTDTAYMSLHPFVRRPGPESDMHMLKPMEYHAGTSELIQILQRGHHGVEIEELDWEKLYTWIDLNAPHRGKWSPPEFRDFDQDERRKCFAKRYANVDVDPEAEYDKLVEYMENLEVEVVKPLKKKRVKYETPDLESWPFSLEQAVNSQNSATLKSEVIDLGAGEKIKFAAIPSGKYIKGNRKGYPDERKPEVVEIKQEFLMSQCEITNAQFALFDAEHDSRYIDQQWKDHTLPGYRANEPEQPVIRVTYAQAVAFCEWLSEKTGRNVSLPSDDQWEWACRAGSESEFWYGDSNTDFAAYENLSDHQVRQFAVQGVNPRFIGDKHPKMPYYAFIPREHNVNDGNMVVASVGSYKPNPWGLYDMHGNVAEWTSTSYKLTGTAQDQFYSENMKVVKGGSWRDRPKKSKAGSKRYYEPYQKVYNVGFRVVIE